MFDPADKDLFVLEVNGDSMIEDQIADGDFVVIRKQKTARKGQIVVAITDEGEATLKRWFPERNRIRLEPANAAMKPIFVRNAAGGRHRRRGGAEAGVDEPLAKPQASGCRSACGFANSNSSCRSSAWLPATT